MQKIVLNHKKNIADKSNLLVKGLIHKFSAPHYGAPVANEQGPNKQEGPNTEVSSESVTNEQGPNKQENLVNHD